MDGRITIMRSHTIRTAVRFGMMMAVASGVTFASAQAHAGDVTTGPGGTAVGPNTSIGSAALKYEHTKGLPTDIRTNWSGIDIKIAKVALNVGIKIDPVTNGGPLFVVDMPKGALIEANWGSDKKILLKAQNGAQTDGLVTVRHTLTPSIDLTLSGAVNATFSYNATQLVNKIPGAKFNFDSKAQSQFAPWAFTAVDTKLNAPDLSNAILFSLDMDKLPDFVAENVDGYFGVRASTKPTFSYKTTKIVMSGADGQITNNASELTVPAIDGDYMEVMAAVEGEMNVKGSIGIAPFIHFDKVGSYAISTDLGIDVYNKDYTVPPTKVAFQTVMVHIPMPNVHVPTKGVDMGSVKVGGQATKTVEIENSGEKEAVMSFKSSDPQFSVTSETVTVAPKGKYELTVKFSPESANAAAADITVASSDADSPEQTFTIGANGADVGQDKEKEDGEGGGASSDSGCGCKTAGSTSSVPGWAGLGLVGLGAVVLFRRRRNAA
jgi:MYXO-CTERM domain-containing protein